MPTTQSPEKGLRTSLNGNQLRQPPQTRMPTIHPLTTLCSMSTNSHHMARQYPTEIIHIVFEPLVWGMSGSNSSQWSLEGMTPWQPRSVPPSLCSPTCPAVLSTYLTCPGIRFNKCHDTHNQMDTCPSDRSDPGRLSPHRTGTVAPRADRD
ncbi:hypothetical protein J6590_079367 [Homalodisca vitripennis]|nr:hypothetical protein J6590_079367 [Homalodisca vitripennis]